MPKNNVSSSAPKHSTGAAQTIDKQIKASKALKAGFPKDFATKICKVKNYAYLCSAKRTEQSTQDILEPCFRGVPETVPFFGSVRLATKRGSASFFTHVD